MHAAKNFHVPATFAEKVRNLMGWCPHARTFRVTPVLHHEPVSLPASGGAGMPALAFGRANRYWIRSLAFALCMTGVGISLFATAKGDRLAMLGFGLLLAAVLYCAEAIRLWEIFRAVERDGIADSSSWWQPRPACIVPIAGAVLIIGFSGAVFLGFVPGFTMLLLNGFLAGFSAIAWLHLATILAWENLTGIALFSDGTRIYRGILP